MDKVSQLHNPLDPLPPNLIKVEGIKKLEKLIRKELELIVSNPNKALETTDDDGELILNERSSNLPYLLSIVNFIAELDSPPSAVLKPFNFDGTSNKSKINVDIVSKSKDEWYKISARNPKMLSLLAAGGGGYLQKTLLDHAEEHLKCANEHLIFFKPPKVNFYFEHGIGISLAKSLEDMGINVLGKRIEDDLLWTAVTPKYKFNIKSLPSTSQGTENYSDLSISNLQLENIKKLNLDITALLCFVSNLTNTRCNIDFKKPILAQQANDEKLRPQKPILDKIFEGRELYCCETAYKEFSQILLFVGGPLEKARAEEFLKKVHVIPDKISDRLANSLEISGQVKQRSLSIFGTGDSIEAATVTANSGFVRAAKTQGIELAVIIHESRALTEQKENMTSAAHIV